MMNLLTAIVENAWAGIMVLLILGFCIFSHELGHFLAARWRGLHIDAFSIGFRKIWSKKVNGVEYRIGWIPFGGYVELPQVDATDEIPKSADGVELPRAKPMDRIATAIAGPSFNIISGMLLACIIWFTGVPQPTPVMDGIEVRAIDQSGPEYAAGLRAGDKIIKVDGKHFRGTWMDFVNKNLMTIGKVELTVERGKEQLKIGYVPQENPNAPAALKHEKIAYPFFQPKIPVIMNPASGSVAEKAGIRKGDTLLAVNDQPLSDLIDFQIMLNYSDDQELIFKVERDGETRDIPVKPEPVPGVTEGTYLIGIVFDPAQAQPAVGEVRAGSPAAEAGLLPGDQLLTLDGEKLASIPQMQEKLQQDKGKTIELGIRRGEENLTLAMTPRLMLPKTVGLELEFRAYYSPIRQFLNMVDMTYKSLRGMSVYLANKLHLTNQTSSIKPRHMSGPIGIGTMLFTAVKYTTFSTVIYFIVIFSFALAIFNLLPLPVLDGGHIAFAVIELALGKPLPTKVIKLLSNVFVILLISLMLYVTFFDILRLYNKIAPEEATLPEPKTEEPVQPEQTDPEAAGGQEAANAAPVNP